MDDGRGSGSGSALYVSVGPALTRFTIDLEDATLTRRETVQLPENVQYAWLHANHRCLYVASSNGTPGGGPRGSRHYLSAFHVAPETGVLSALGEPMTLPERPIYLSTDRHSDYTLLAFNNPAAIRVYRIGADGAPGEEVPQIASIDPGIFPHQIRTTPNDRQVTVTARGNDATPDKAEDPGRLTVFDFDSGLLRPAAVIAPNGGINFGPRDLDFHPNRPWAYLSLERENEIVMLDWQDEANPQLRHRKTTLAHPERRLGRQIAGVVHVHPKGHVAYVANRASATKIVDGREVLIDGENSLAVFAIDQDTGEPHLIQSIETEGVHPRTFHIDPSGQLLVAAHTMAGVAREGEGFRDIPARLTIFRIAADGTLTLTRSYDVDVGKHLMFWMGMFAC
jgi:6-phosphogluconolactonase